MSAPLVPAKRDVRREVSLDGLKESLERSTIHLGKALQGRDETPSADVERRERAVLLADLMSELSPAYRDVLVLRNLQGLGFDEVAARMERSPAAVKMLWMRAISAGLWRKVALKVIRWRYTRRPSRV